MDKISKCGGCFHQQIVPGASSGVVSEPSVRSVWGLDTLGFNLPDFNRQSWVSELACDRWKERILTFARSSAETGWHSVALGIRPCSLCWLSADELLVWYTRSRKCGLRILPLTMRKPKSDGYAFLDGYAHLKNQLLFRIVVGKKSDVACFKTLWRRGDHAGIGRLLGYPECCCQFFEQVVVRDQLIDNTWPTAWNTASPSVGTRMLEIDCPEVLNTLWRTIGVVIIPHLPCSFRCERSLRFGEALITVARDIGYGAEMNWAVEMLRWPAEWSALHGIAEIKTPILKISSNTVATAHKYVVRWLGSSYPKEGASGISFPYQTRAHARGGSPGG